MSEIEMKRDAISKAYDSTAWRDKVKLMSDAQVLAVFMRLQKDKRI